MLHMPSLFTTYHPCTFLYFYYYYFIFFKKAIYSLLFSPVYLSDCLQGQMMKMPRLTKGCPCLSFFWKKKKKKKNDQVRDKKEDWMMWTGVPVCSRLFCLLFLLRLVLEAGKGFLTLERDSSFGNRRSYMTKRKKKISQSINGDKVISELFFFSFNFPLEKKKKDI